MLNNEKNIAIQNSIDKFYQSVNSAYQMDFAKQYSMIGDHKLYGGKHAGSQAEHEGSRIIAEELIKIGLQNVEQIPVESCKFTFVGVTWLAAISFTLA